ncbi:MAG TPA: hypothetical protein PLN55_09900 [Burkholderiaceae bacterium]|nr:hypothetical protein [Burkholderiaceae bacterium]
MNDRRRPHPVLEIDPLDPTVFLRSCAALDAQRRSTDTPALPASLWRPATKKKAMRYGNR